ncbi:MAG: DUF58 domain-containing protein [Dehalococcoidia bacterium]|nr:DUF58 domain-containing protein [Dehalococcoidia bacterium]
MSPLAISDTDDYALALSVEALARVRSIEIRARRRAASMTAGSYRSVFRGTGIEFAEAREYVPGDDARRIDWNVTARMGTPWVKEYVEERELTVVCAVDVSASALAARPSRGRFEAAAETVALLSFSAAFNHDRTGLLLFDEGIRSFIPPRRGVRQVTRLVGDILCAQRTAPGHTTDIAAAADYLGRVLRRRSTVFLISDFIASGYEESLRGLSRRHEVIAVTLIDPLDIALPDVGIIEVVDAERGGRVLLDSSSARVREAYAAAAAERAVRRRGSLAAAGVDEVEVRLDRDLTTPLAAYFRRRAKVI